MDFQDFRQEPSSESGIGTMHDTCDFHMATAAELMYFNGAPLAHVVAYREHLRLEGIARRNQEFSRRTRRLRPSLQAHMLPQSSAW